MWIFNGTSTDGKYKNIITVASWDAAYEMLGLNGIRTE